MPIEFDKRNKAFRFKFNRVIAGTRQRASRLLPKEWTRAQADEFDRLETARLYALATGVVKPAPLIEEAVLAYLEEHAPDLKNFSQIQSTLAAMHAWYAARPLDELANVASAYSVAMRGKIAPATLRNHLAYLRSACRWAWKHKGLGEADPAGRMVMPKVNNARHVYLDRAQMLQIARAMVDTKPGATGQRRARAAFRIGFYSGMRLGEVLAARILTTPGGLLFELATSKNGEPRRVPVHPKIAHIVRNRALWPIKLHASTVSHYAKAAMIATGHGHARLHDLRHSTASAMINEDVDLYTVGGVLGHKSPVSTKRYAHLATATLKNALAKIGKKMPTKPEAKAA